MPVLPCSAVHCRAVLVPGKQGHRRDSAPYGLGNAQDQLDMLQWIRVGLGNWGCCGATRVLAANQPPRFFFVDSAAFWTSLKVTSWLGNLSKP